MQILNGGSLKESPHDLFCHVSRPQCPVGNLLLKCDYHPDL